MNKFLVIGGTHGNEPLGIEVCKRLEEKNIPYLDVLYANERAISQKKRFAQDDLNRVFPGTKRSSYESSRAKQIVEICKKYDFVIDFHNTNCPENDCGFVGGSDYMETAQLSLFLGLDRVIVADYDCINKFVRRCLSVEISLSSKKCDVDFWVRRMIGLKDFNQSRNYGKADLYKFSYRITREQQNMFNFPKWKAFRKVPRNDLKPLNLNQVYYPIFIDDAYTPYNYAGLIQKLL